MLEGDEQRGVSRDFTPRQHPLYYANTVTVKRMARV